MVAVPRFCLLSSLVLLCVGGCDRTHPLEPALQASKTSGSTLNAPSNANAVAVSENRIDIMWQDNSTNESGFELHRSIGVSGFVTLASTGAGGTSYGDLGLAASTQHCYRIRAFRTTGRNTRYSQFSTTVCAMTLAPPPPPAPPPPSEPPLAPSFTDATPLGSAQVIVRWADNSTEEAGFRVERSLDAGATWTSAGTVGPDATLAQDDGRTSEQPVCYRVIAFNVSGDSPWSDMDCTTPPAGPTNLTIAGVDPLTWEIELSWTDNSAVEDGYQVWGCATFDGRSFCGPIDLLPPESTSYRFQWDGSSDTYWVVAMKDNGRSDPSNLVTLTHPGMHN